MPTIEDKEFGTIIVRRSAMASHVRIRVAPNGTLRASLPMYAPLFTLKRLLKSSRDELRQLLNEQQPGQLFSDGMQIGKSHTLVVRLGTVLSVDRHGQQIIVSLPPGEDLNSPKVTMLIRHTIQAALRIEAKNYLPRRLAYLANQLGYDYEKVRFSHASGRWGSCSSNGTISLNIALMKLPHELIDYVLIHELSHTEQMNHSDAFWKLVAVGDPQFKQHRKILKTHTPTI
jgi:hypothetical protein